MKHIRKFESYSIKRKLDKAIKESVMIVDDVYKVNINADIPQSLINAYIKKVKDSLDKNARQFYSDVQIAEEITKYVLQQGLNIDKLDPSSLFGGGAPAQGQAQPAVQVQSQSQTVQAQPVQEVPQAQAQAPQAQAQAPQAQAPQAQAQAPQAQAQAPQAQAQAPQSQSQGEFEEVEETEEEREERERREREEELPL
jgi:hypothetical protein